MRILHQIDRMPPMFLTPFIFQLNFFTFCWRSPQSSFPFCSIARYYLHMEGATFFTSPILFNHVVDENTS